MGVERLCQDADMKVKIENDEPRAYGDFMPYACMSAPPKKLEMKDGKHVLPLFGAEKAAAEALLLENQASAMPTPATMMGSLRSISTCTTATMTATTPSTHRE